MRSTQLGTKSSRATNPSSFAFAQPVTAAQEVTVKDGEEGLASLVCRDVDVPADVWDAHASWYRHAAMESISEGYLEAVPRRSIFYLPVLSPYHPVAAVWTFFMLFVDLVYTAFWVPIGVAFCTESFGDIHSGCTQADLLGGCIYFMNVIMGFQCGMVLRHNYKRTKVVDGVRVALYYARYGRFWLDLLAVVPFIYLIVILCLPDASDANRTSWVGILSLIRLVRLLRLVSLSKVVVSNTLSGRYQDMVSRHINVTTMYTLLLVYCVAVIINLEACIMLLIAYLEGLDQSWLTSVSWEDFTTVSQPYQWYAAVYWVITTSTTTGYGDFAPHSTVEQVFANIYMIAGMVLFGLLVGTIANALTRASASAAQLYRFRKKMSSIGHWLVEHSVPERTQKQVKDYFSDVWVSRDQTSLDTEIFNDLPTSLRNKVAQYITMDVVIRVHLFRDQEDGLQQLVAAALRPVDVIQGHDICRQGEEGDRLWICSEGELQALQHQAEPSYPRTPCLLGESVLLGDELASFRLRPWTLRASRGLVKLWELKLSDLWPIVRMYPRLKEDLLDYIKLRLLQELGFSQKGSIVEKSWCESVESISAALLKQSASVVEAAAQELQAAQLEDGSLACLLDGLLEFSTIRTKRVTLLQPGQLEGKQSSIDGSNMDMPMGPVGQQGSIVSSHAPSLLVQSRSMRRGTYAPGGELVLSPATSMAQVTIPQGQQGSGHPVLMAACGSCGRAVCGSCRQVVRGNGMVAGAGQPGTGVSPFIMSAPSVASMPDGAARHQSKLLTSMGLQSAARGGWRPVSRVSQRSGAARTGVSTMSMAASRSALTATSIPTENFGEGYGLWG